MTSISYSYDKYTLYLVFLSVFILCSYSRLYGADADIINEDDLFSETNSVVEAKEMVDESVMKETNKFN